MDIDEYVMVWQGRPDKKSNLLIIVSQGDRPLKTFGEFDFGSAFSFAVEQARKKGVKALWTPKKGRPTTLYDPFSVN